jgi:phage terminase large subunit
LSAARPLAIAEADLAARLRARAEIVRSPSWPMPVWADDPVGFCTFILGIELWEKQVEIAKSVCDHPLTSVKSGHRIGKSTIAAALALWFYCSFEDARVVMTAPVTRQVEGIFWRMIRMLHERSGRCVNCKRADPAGIRIPRPCPHSMLLDGKLGESAATGLKSGNFREIHGYTAKHVEAITGTAGANLFFILDEASGIPNAIFEGLEGNRAGWSEEPGVKVRQLFIGNPTKTSGDFYDSHEHPKKKLLYNRITVSSRETPNVVQGRVVIKALATAEWIAQMEAKYGADSAFIKVRVDGVFPVGEDGKAFSIDFITRSQERWDEAETEGPLYIGVDPAGESGTGDDAAFSARRGFKQLALRTHLGLTPQAHGEELLLLVEDLRAHPRERVIVIVDSEGPIGTRVYQHLVKLAHKTKSFEVHAVRASDRAPREGREYDRMRDLLAAFLHRWMRAGGALLEDELLEEELHVLEWGKVGDKVKITPKKEIRKEIGRSPDRYDATALSAWEPAAASSRTGHGDDVDDLDADDDFEAADVRDPYAHRDTFDPYRQRE